MSRLPKSLISHWHHSRPGLQASSQEFYAAIERRLTVLNLPNTKVSRVLWREAGMFSAKREYLRVQRREYQFDICGAPFGDGFFTSWWLGGTPVSLLVRLALLGLCFALWIFVAGVLGNLTNTVEMTSGVTVGAMTLVALIRPAVVLGGAATAVLAVLHLAVLSSALRQEVVEAIPFVGWVYRFLVSPFTYYRLDTALMFRNAVHAVVIEALEEITAEKGMRVSLTEQERKPVMRGMIAA